MGSTLSLTHLRGLTSGSNANEILVDSGHDLFATGHVIQVKKNTINTRTAFTSTAYVTSGLSINFTPKRSTSMLHVMCTGTMGDYASLATVGTVFRRVIGATTSYSPLGSTGHGNINSPDGATMGLYQGPDGGTNNKQTPFTMEWFDDTHDTTSQITYTVMVANNGNGSYTTSFGGLGNQNDYNIVSTLSVWEIAQ